MSAPARKGAIALLFSGGIDSTVAAARLAEEHTRVHLLTFRNGYGHWGFSRVNKRVDELKSRYPGRIEAFFADTKDVFDALAVSTIKQDAVDFGAGFIWCLGCKLAMHTRAIGYCLENDIAVVADGSASDTDEMVEQSLVSLSLISHLYEDHGLRFETPVYDMSRDDKRRWLADQGFRMGFQIAGRHMGIQPTCHAGEVYYLSYLLFNKRVRHDERKIARYIESRRPRISAWLNDRLGQGVGDGQPTREDGSAHHDPAHPRVAHGGQGPEM